MENKAIVLVVRGILVDVGIVRMPEDGLTMYVDSQTLVSGLMGRKLVHEKYFIEQEAIIFI